MLCDLSEDTVDLYGRIGGKMKMRPGKPALNNFKAYGWQK